MKNFQKLLAFPVSFLLAAALASPSALALAPGDLLVPVGEAVGIEMDSDGVIVSGLAAVQTDAGQVSPAGDAGLLPGDRITALNGVPIHSGEDFLAAVSALTGDPVALQADRAGGAVSFTVQPRKIPAACGSWACGSGTAWPASAPSPSGTPPAACTARWATASACPRAARS